LAQGAIELQVNWDSISPKESAGGYKVSVSGRSLKEKSPTLNEGKLRALLFARRLLASASSEVEGFLSEMPESISDDYIQRVKGQATK
jgi:hypothetical protein